MLRSVPLSTRVYDYLFPSPQKDVDPSTWQEHVKKNLVPEMRLEVHQFYGKESRSLEGRYPGLDYSSGYHRMRLSRYTNHRRLFRALDALALTPWEIFTLCDWEGTLIVKGRFEHQQSMVLRDTTGDDIAVAPNPYVDAAPSGGAGAHPVSPAATAARRPTAASEYADGPVVEDDYAKDDDDDEDDDEDDDDDADADEGADDDEGEVASEHGEGEVDMDRLPDGLAAADETLAAQGRRVRSSANDLGYEGESMAVDGQEQPISSGPEAAALLPRAGRRSGVAVQDMGGVSPLQRARVMMRGGGGQATSTVA